MLTIEQRLIKAERDLLAAQHGVFSRPVPPTYDEFLVQWGRIQQIRDHVEDLKIEARGSDPD